MENLDSDVTMEILKKLSGKDILATCKTSKKLNDICMGERYQRLWKDKLLEEYEVSYEKGDLTPYKKYIETMKLHERSFYRLTLYMVYDGDTFSYFFNNRENAISYATYLILADEKEENYYHVRNILESDNYYESDFENRYTIEKIKLSVSPEKFSKESKKYDLILKEIKKEFPNHQEIFYSELRDLIFSQDDEKEEKINTFSTLYKIPKEKILEFISSLNFLK